ncbi:hypothetical protein BBP40_008494 [Aspergillus hancockii]|nr:hypothetical protein BBP40_008494 [Aspergillus hancockii]
MLLYILLSVTVWFLFYLRQKIFLAGTVPDGVPWAGSSSRPFMRTRSIIVTMFDPASILLRLYREVLTSVSTQPRPFVLSTLTDGPVVVLPPQSIRWIIRQPVKLLSFLEGQRQRFHLKYTIPDDITHVPLYAKLVYSVLKRHGCSAAADIHEEMQRSVDATWGMDSKQWKSICLYENVLSDILTASNRMFVGLPLCRNKKYLGIVTHYMEWFLPLAMAVKLLPSILRPIFGSLVGIPAKYYAYQFAKYATPIVNQNLASMNNDDWRDGSGPPNTFITWYIKEARKNLSTEQKMSPDKVTAVLMAANFAAVHNVAIIATQGILSIAGSDPDQGIVERIRTEVRQVSKDANGTWSQETLAEMHFLDNVVQEILRLHQSDLLSLRRLVMTDIVTDGGLFLKKGTSIAVSSYGPHRDPSIYPDPNVFNPFRYTRPSGDELHSDHGASKDDNTAWGSTSTSETYLPFGHGRNACPGRWFAIMLLKMHIAYVLLNYDIQLSGQKPEGWRLGTLLVPPVRCKVLVRRRPMGEDY